jgi:hypothetical protein
MPYSLPGCRTCAVMLSPARRRAGGLRIRVSAAVFASQRRTSSTGRWRTRTRGGSCSGPTRPYPSAWAGRKAFTPRAVKTQQIDGVVRRLLDQQTSGRR